MEFQPDIWGCFVAVYYGPHSEKLLNKVLVKFVVVVCGGVGGGPHNIEMFSMNAKNYLWSNKKKILDVTWLMSLLILGHGAPLALGDSTCPLERDKMWEASELNCGILVSLYSYHWTRKPLWEPELPQEC